MQDYTLDKLEINEKVSSKILKGNSLIHDEVMKILVFDKNQNIRRLITEICITTCSKNSKSLYIKTTKRELSEKTGIPYSRIFTVLKICQERKLILIQKTVGSSYLIGLHPDLIPEPLIKNKI